MRKKIVWVEGEDWLNFVCVCVCVCVRVCVHDMDHHVVTAMAALVC
jgi:hypothetical protein